MQFFNPGGLVYFWILPLILGVFYLSKKIRAARIRQIGSPATVEKKLIASYRPHEAVLRLICLLLAFFFAVLALARPQWGEEVKKVQRKGVDLIFMLDTSLSMLADDIKPNRIKKAKVEMRNVIEKLKGDRVGMVAFAGTGFLQTPLTLDYAAFFLFLDSVEVGHIPYPGTLLDSAIQLAAKAFQQQDLKHKALLLFTDGEDQGSNLDAAIQVAKDAGLRVYAIGVGTPEGAPIPLKDEKGKVSGFKKDRQGQVVVTKLNAEVLEKIATATGGLYLPATPGEDEIDLILRHMESLGQKTMKERDVTEREDHFQLFLIFSLLFVVLEMLVSRRIARAKPALALFGLWFLCSGFLESTYSLNEKGNELYEQKKYQSAVESYRKAQVKKPDDPAVRYNLATTLHQVEEYQEASKQLEKSIDGAKGTELESKALYNYGNTQYRLGNFEKAIESYQKVLEIDPADKDAKYNLEFLQNKKKLFDQKNQNQQQNQKNQQQNQQNQQQNQQNQQQNQQQQNKQQNQQQNQQQQQQQNQQNQQQNQQNQQQGQGGQQDKPDQQQNQQQNQSQDQQQKNQNQSEQEKQDNQEQQQGGGQQEQQEQPKPEQDQSQQDQQQQNQQNQDQEEQQKDQQQQNQNQSQQDQPQGEQEKPASAQPQPEGQEEQDKPQEQQQQPASPQEQEGEEQQNEQPQSGSQQGEQSEEQKPAGQSSQGSSRQPLQGQMSLDSALRILDALKESEKELSDLRRPQAGDKEGIPYVEKDW